MTRLDTALAEIQHRREIAQAATPGPWESFFGRVRRDGSDVFLVTTSGRYSDPPFISANDPAHVLAVLDAAEATLKRHRAGTVDQQITCAVCWYLAAPEPTYVGWPCPDALAQLDIYAPSEQP